MKHLITFSPIIIGKKISGHMKIKLLLAAICILLSSPVTFHGATQDEKVKYGMWLMHYHLNPSPAEFPVVVSEMDRLGLFDNPKYQYPFLGFASRLFQEHPDRVRTWFDGFNSLKESTREILHWSLWLSGIENINNLKKIYNYSYPKNNYFGFDGYRDSVGIGKMNMLRPGYLDLNWGQYMASGDKEAVIRILNFLKFYVLIDNPKNEEERLKGEAARGAIWSLNSNCKTIPGLKELLGDIYIEKTLDQPDLSYLGLLLLNVYPERFYSKSGEDGKIYIFVKPLK